LPDGCSTTVTKTFATVTRLSDDNHLNVLNGVRQNCLILLKILKQNFN